jgi:hypothetical protein
MARTRKREKGDALEQLYAVDLESFVAERDTLARSLRGEGKEQEATVVAALRKPPLAAFLANRLARERPRETAALITAAEQLSAAHRKGGGADEVREAQARHGEALRNLLENLDDGVGRTVSAAVEQRLAATLRAASVDPDAASLLRRGILPDEVEPAGFDALAGMPVRHGSTSKAKARKDRAPSSRPGRGEAARHARAERLEEELREAKDALESAKRGFKAAERERDRAERRVSDLADRLERTG